MSVQKILENFGVKAKKDLQKSLTDKQKAKAAKYGRSYNQNSRLKNSIKYTVKETATAIELNLYMEDYGDIVDKGRRPGPVSQAGQLSIKNWIKIKGLNPSQILSVPGKKKLSFETASKQFAFLVTRKVSKKGFEGNDFYSSVINDGRLDQLKKDIEKESVKEIIISFNNGNNNATITDN